MIVNYQISHCLTEKIVKSVENADEENQTWVTKQQI